MFRHIIRTSWKDAGNATHACVWPSAGSQMCWEHRLRMGPHVAPCRCRVARGRAARAGPREAPVKLRCAGPGILPGRCLCTPGHRDEVVHEPRALEPCGGHPAAHSFPTLSPPQSTSVSFPKVMCCRARVPTGCPIDCSVFGLMSPSTRLLGAAVCTAQGTDSLALPSLWAEHTCEAGRCSRKPHSQLLLPLPKRARQ